MADQSMPKRSRDSTPVITAPESMRTGAGSTAASPVGLVPTAGCLAVGTVAGQWTRLERGAPDDVLTVLADGSLAWGASAAAAVEAHTHSASEITTGVIAVARLAASGTPSASTYLRGDSTWATLASGTGDVVGPASATDGCVVVFDGVTGKLVKNSTVPVASVVVDSDLGTAAALNVAAAGNATSGQVVKGNDTRLTDARTPTTHTHAQSDVTNLTTDLAARITGPGSSVDNTVPRFDLTTGKIIQTSGVSIDDSDNVLGVASVGSAALDADVLINFPDSAVGKGALIGKMWIGNLPTYAGYAVAGYADVAKGSLTDWGFLQDSAGNATLNAPSGHQVGVVIAGGTGLGGIDAIVCTATNVSVPSCTLTLAFGASINEFSTDGTLAGNSDSAAPTEKAVATALSSGLSGKANTSHTHVVADVTDAGTMAAEDAADYTTTAGLAALLEPYSSPMSMHYRITTAIAVGAVNRPYVTSNSSLHRLVIPAGHDFVVTFASIMSRAGSTAGTYVFELGIGRYPTLGTSTGASVTTLVTLTTSGAANEYGQAAARGTLASPIATIAGDASTDVVGVVANLVMTSSPSSVAAGNLHTGFISGLIVPQ